MQRNTLFLLCVCSATFLSTELFAQTPVAPGGMGTINSPYLISSIDNLAWVSKNNSSWNSYFKQTADIAAGETSVWNKFSGFKPIGNDTVPFKGNYNGNGKTISFLTIKLDSTDYIGLFGKIQGTECRITDLTISDASVRGRNYVGILVGEMDSATITNCHVSGAISAAVKVGGLAGTASYGRVIYSSSKASVKSSGRNSYIGGFGGILDNSMIICCYSTGSVSSSGARAFAGGFTGRFTDFASQCYTLDTVEAIGDSSIAGGFSGVLSSNGKTSSRLLNCFVAGPVWISGSDSYSRTGAITGLTSSFAVTNCYWDIQACEITDSSHYGTGTTTENMMKQSTYKDWNFDYIWEINPGEYPHLRTEVAWPSGSGTPVDPYRVATLANLYILSTNSDLWDKSFVQTADIDAAATLHWAKDSGWSPIGTSSQPFSGVYDGKGKKISNLVIKRGLNYTLGFFGSVKGTGCRIKNVNLRDIAVTNTSNYSASELTGPSTGGLAGRICGNAKMNNCSVTGTVTGPDARISVGGLVGTADTAFVANCYSNCTVYGYGISNTGGLMGIRCSCPLLNCYSASKIIVDEYYASFIGGLIGVNYSEPYSSIFQCFWDKQRAGIDTSRAGYAKTTTEMQTQSTFTNWDFTDCWKLTSGSYPEVLPPVEVATVAPEGFGTEAAPYLIATQENLAWLMQNNKAWSCCYRQTADIHAESSAHWECGSGWQPLGYESCPFRGVYDGGGKSITGLTVRRLIDEHTGFIGYAAGKGCRLKNITLDHSIIEGHRNTGSIAGEADSIEITGCRAIGNVSASVVGAKIGGLIGYSLRSKIINCHHLDTVSGNGDKQTIGGLIGYGGLDSIADCSKTGSVFSNNEDCIIGGLVGDFTSGSIHACTTNCEIKFAGRSNKAGGLIGDLHSVGFPDGIYRCISSGSIFFTDKPSHISGGNNFVGGLVGYVFGGSTVKMSMNYSSISGSGYSSIIGGLVGYNLSTNFSMCGTTGAITITGKNNHVGRIAGSTDNSIDNCFGRGPIAADIADTVTYVNGLIAHNSNATLNNCYSAGSFTLTGLPYVIRREYGSGCFCDLEAAGAGVYSTDSMSNGISTAQMKTESTFKNSGWDFKNIWQIDPAINDGYPSFRWLYAGTPIEQAMLPIAKNKVTLSILNRYNTISYTLPEATQVSLKVFNLKGACVGVLIDNKQPAGRHVISGLGRRLGSGSYILVFKAGAFKAVRTIVPM
jgi:hypothetical protein